MDPVLADTLHLAIALLFAGAALHKGRERAAFQAALANYQILPPAMVGPAATGLIATELTLCLLLVVPATARAGALGAAAILLVYTVGIAINLARGRSDIDCGCGGVFGPKRLGTNLLWRNALLLIACAIAALPDTQRPLVLLDRITVCLAVASIALTYYAAGLLAGSSQSPSRRRIP